MLKILSKKIDDGRFLELIRKFLKAGYLEFNQKYNSLSGTPQGGIISPILANIYLHEFDKFMEGISAEYTKGNSGDHIVNIRFSNTNETVQKRKAIRNKRMSTCGKCRISLP